MKPIIVVPEGTMSAEAIKLLNDNDLCVVEAKNPADVKFIDPIPCAAQRTKIEDAAIQLSRKLLNARNWTAGTDVKFTFADIARFYVECLIQGTRLQFEPTEEEQKQRAYNEAILDEQRKIAREDARAKAAATRGRANAHHAKPERKESDKP